MIHTKVQSVADDNMYLEKKKSIINLCGKNKTKFLLSTNLFGAIQYVEKLILPLFSTNQIILNVIYIISK